MKGMALYSFIYVQGWGGLLPNYNFSFRIVWEILKRTDVGTIQNLIALYEIVWNYFFLLLIDDFKCCLLCYYFSRTGQILQRKLRDKFEVSTSVFGCYAPIFLLTETLSELSSMDVAQSAVRICLIMMDSALEQKPRLLRLSIQGVKQTCAVEVNHYTGC